jgi:spermidine synthase
VYALSTLGSIAGSFLPVLLLIPTLGTARTFLVLALALLLPSVVGLLIGRSRGPALAALLAGLIIPAAAVAAPTDLRPAERGVLLEERESAYNYIQVVEQDGANLLILNEGHAVHSVYDPETLLTGGPWDSMMLAPLVVDGIQPSDIQRVMIIGLAGGSTARQMSDPRVFGPIPIDGVEIDPEVAEVGRRWFGLDDLSNVNVIVEDGRYALRTTPHRYDIVAIDAFRQPYIPFQLTTREFFDDVAAHLSPHGTVVVNVGRTVTDYRLVDALASTLRASFDHVYAIDVPGYLNTVVIGTNAPSSLDNVAAAADLFPDDSPIRVVADRLADADPRVVDPGPIVFTDDHAPVEQVIDSIIIGVAREVTGP